MRTNIDIDDGLMAAAQEATGLPTKRAVVEEGLRTLVRLREQQGVRALRGRVRFVEEPPEGEREVLPELSSGAPEERDEGGRQEAREVAVVPDPPREAGNGATARTKGRMLSIKRRAPRTKGGVEGAASGGDRQRR
jgi:hypothetical protein